MIRNKNTWKFLQNLLPYLRPHTVGILVMYGFAIINVGSMIGLPLLMQRGIDLGIVAGDRAYLIRTAGAILGLGILQYLSLRFQGILMMKIGNQVLYNLRKDLFEHIQKQSIPFFDRNKAGNLMTRVTSDVLVLEELLMAGLDSLLVDFLMIGGLIGAMIFLNGWLSLILVVIIPSLLIIVFRLQKKIVLAAGGIQEKLSRVNSFLNESLSGIQVSRAFAREEKNIQHFHRVNDEYYQDTRKFYPLHAYFWQAVATLNIFSQGLVIMIGGLLLYNSMITIGVIVAYLNYVTRLFQPMQKISNMLNQLSKAKVSGNRIFEILNEPIQIDDVPNPVKGFTLRGDVEFQNVCFAYKPDEPVLQDVSFSLTAGQVCAIVGHTGSGKSTIVNLISRFYDCQGGQVLIDGVNIKDYSQHDLRSQMAAVMQDPQIFSGTISDAIRFGKKDATEQEIIQVATTLGIHGMIESFPLGYKTELGQEGGNISLGQKQLIAFARALIRNPSILILDEASAYLDSETETIVQKALIPLMKGRSSFVIAHRLSTIRHADLILVLEQGKIVERGTHGELVKLNGVYAGFLQGKTISQQRELTSL